MQKKTTLKKHLGKSWRKYFAKPETITDLFGQLGITDHEFKDIQTRHEIDDERLVLIIRTTKKDTGDLGRIIIDARMGEPTWRQMIDLTFTLGRDCDKRILVYEDGSANVDQHDLIAGYSMTYGFASILNSCKIDTYIVGAKPSSENEGGVSYEIVASPKNCNEIEIDQLPSQTQFQMAEFWLYYSHHETSVEPPLSYPEDWIYLEWTHFTEDPELSLFLTWNDQGMFLTASNERTFSPDQKYTALEALQWIAAHRLDDLRRVFHDYEIEVQEKSRQPFRILIWIHRKPFTEFAYGTSKEKYDFSVKATTLVNEFRDRLNELNQEFNWFQKGRNSALKEAQG